MRYFYPTEGENLNCWACRETPSCQFPRLVRHPDLPMRKTLRVVGLLTVMILFQSEKFIACKIKDERGDDFLFFDSIQSTEDYSSI